MLLKAYKALHRFDLEVNLEKYLKVLNFNSNLDSFDFNFSILNKKIIFYAKI